MERVRTGSVGGRIDELEVRRGDIVYANLNPVIGSGARWHSSCIGAANDIGNRHSPTTIVAAITSRIKKAKLPTHVEICADEYGLERDSVILLEQLRTIDKRRLKEKLAHLDKESMERVNEGLMISLGLIEL